jgi:hypothetical protein
MEIQALLHPQAPRAASLGGLAKLPVGLHGLVANLSSSWRACFYRVDRVVHGLSRAGLIPWHGTCLVQTAIPGIVGLRPPLAFIDCPHLV